MDKTDDDSRSSEEIATIFKLRDLADLFEQLGLTEGKVHTTKPKEMLLTHVPDMQAYRQVMTPIWYSIRTSDLLSEK